MIHPHSDSGVDHGTVLLPNLIRTIAGMHDDEFLLVAQGGVSCMSQQRQAQDCGHSPNSGHSPVRERADLCLSEFSQLRPPSPWIGIAGPFAFWHAGERI